MCKKRKGFTLIELLVVVVIIGILASVSSSIMIDFSDKAIATEAITMLRFIHDAERMHLLQFGGQTRGISTLVQEGFLQYSDLDGTYFSRDCYMNNVYHASGPTYYFVCIPGLSEAPQGYKVTSGKWAPYGQPKNITMSSTGKIYSNVEGLGYEDVGWDPW